MPLKSMKLTVKESKAEVAPDFEKPKFPYGLTVRLDEETISKLGMSDLPKVGDSKMLVAFVDVTETNENETLEGKKHRSIRLQITDMSIEEKVKPDVLKTLYGDDKK